MYVWTLNFVQSDVQVPYSLPISGISSCTLLHREPVSQLRLEGCRAMRAG